MQRYLAQRLLLFIPAIFMASLLIFGIMRVLPGDVALVILGGGGVSFDDETYQSLRDQLGLNDPFHEQYGRWAWSMLKGEFGGKSLENQEPIRAIVARRFPVTLQLTLYTIVLSVMISVPLGVVAALKQDKWPDYVVRLFTIAGLAIPNFWTALMVILGLLLVFRWSPPVIYADIWEDPWTHFQIMIWPSLVLAWTFSSYLTRVTRSSMLEVLRQDYIRTAQSKGLAERVVVWRHALRNTLIPVVTVAGIYLGTMLGGAVILEAIFGLPGLGEGIVDAALNRDYLVIQSLATMLVFMMLAVNLLVDVAYVVIDPRISYRS